MVCSRKPTPPTFEVASPVKVEAISQGWPPILPSGCQRESVEPRQRAARVGCPHGRSPAQAGADPAPERVVRLVRLGRPAVGLQLPDQANVAPAAPKQGEVAAHVRLGPVMAQRNVTQAYLQADRLVPASTIDSSKGCLRRIVRVLVCRSPQHECTEQARPRARRRSTSRSLVPRDERGGRTAATRQLIRLKRTGRDGEPLCVPLPGGWPALEASATRWICFGAGRSSGFGARAGTAAAGAARVRVAHSRRARGGLPRAARRRARND